MAASNTINRRHRSRITIGSENLDYTILEVDARNEAQRGDNFNLKNLNGDLIVYIPGHVQRVEDASNFLEYAARRSPAGLVWSIDVPPPIGGDPVKAAAIVKIVSKRLEEALSLPEDDLFTSIAPVGVTLFGYSHGGGIVLRAAEMAPRLFKNVAALCPVGLLGRTHREFVVSSSKEGRRVLLDTLGNFAEVMPIIKLAAGGSLGLVDDFLRTKSLKRLVDDAFWVTQKIPGGNYGFTGNVILLFARNDALIRWQSMFPQCDDPGEIEQYVWDYQQSDFPRVRKLMVRVLKGNHLGPLLDVNLYIDTAFNLLAYIEHQDGDEERLSG